jgi:hypothetical protein
MRNKNIYYQLPSAKIILTIIGHHGAKVSTKRCHFFIFHIPMLGVRPLVFGGLKKMFKVYKGPKEFVALGLG